MGNIKIFLQKDKIWWHIMAKVIQFGGIINGNNITVNHAGIIFKHKGQDWCMDIRKLQGVKIKKWTMHSKKKKNYVFDTQIPIINEDEFMDFIKQYKHYKYSVMEAIGSFRFKHKALKFINILLCKIKTRYRESEATFCSSLILEVCQAWAKTNKIKLSGILKKDSNSITPQDLYNYYVKIDNKAICKKFY